jgi:hypothetical protein
MNLIKKSDVKNHLSAQPRKNLLPFRPVSQSKATGYSENQLSCTGVNTPSSGADSARHLSSKSQWYRSPTPFRVEEGNTKSTLIASG